MCGRYTLADEAGFVFDGISGVRLEWNGRPRYNIAPSQRGPVIRLEHGLPVISELRWGLVPSWAKDEKIAYSLVNARSETVAEKPAFRPTFKKRRCLVPVDGFYEWQALGAKLKQPWRFVRPDRQPFLFAGLWEHWRNPEDASAEPLETFTILTTTPNRVAAPIHDRMPVILEGDARQQWLDEATTAEALASLLRPYPDEHLTRYAVPALVGSPQNDVPECVVPLPEN